MTDPSAIQSLAQQASVDVEFATRVSEAGILPADASTFGQREVRRVLLLRSWEDAGLSVELVARLIEEGKLSLAFLDTPVIAGPGRLDRTYEDLSIDENVSLAFVQRLHEAIGFLAPRGDELARADDPTMVGLAKIFTSIGVSEAGVLRLFRVYADALRRIAQAEAELFESEVEGRLRSAGLDERQLLEFGSDVGERIIGSLEGSLLAVYRRHREHIWIEHSTNHAEVALDQAGLQPREPRVHTIVFVDLTGYTRLTEEGGDELAARVAAELAALVQDISYRRAGRPIRWLGDGGMFHFRGAHDAVLAALDMADAAPAAGLPPTHIGIHTGPLIFQDGDVYGRTVNISARVASQAGAHEVLVTEETATAAGGGDVAFYEDRIVELKGIGQPVTLFRPTRDPRP